MNNILISKWLDYKSRMLIMIYLVQSRIECTLIQNHMVARDIRDRVKFLGNGVSKNWGGYLGLSILLQCWAETLLQEQNQSISQGPGQKICS